MPACHDAFLVFKRISWQWLALRHLMGNSPQDSHRSLLCCATPYARWTDIGCRPLLTKRLLASLPTHENIYTIPNILTFSRLVASPVIGYLILHDQHRAALALFVYAGATDLVDGWIARRWKLQTVFGTVIDPMADKTLMTILTITLAMKGTMPGENLS